MPQEANNKDHSLTTYFTPFLFNRYCGYHEDLQLIYGGNEMVLYFVTDFVESRKGFLIEWEALDPTEISNSDAKDVDPGCVKSSNVCGLTYSGIEGQITTPGYNLGLYYYPDMTCNWIIIVPPDMVNW